MNDLDNMLATLRNSEPYLDDNGFTAVVMEQVPRRRALPVWKKNAIMLVAAGLGSGIAAVQVPLSQVAGLLNGSQIAGLLNEMLGNVPLLIGAAAFVIYTMSCGAVWIAQRDLI